MATPNGKVRGITGHDGSGPILERPLRRPPFRLSDLWTAPLHGLPIQDEIVYQYLPVSAESRLLEIGPGSGFTAFRLARQVREVTLLDISGENITRLREVLARLPNLDFIHADVCAPELSRIVGSRFDAIFGLQVFDVVSDPGICLANIGALLRPRGHMLLAFDNSYPPRNPELLFFREREELDQLLRLGGYRMWEIYSLRLRPWAHTVRSLYLRQQTFWRAVRPSGGRLERFGYEQSWVFERRRVWERYRFLVHAAWTLIFASLRLAGDCFERVPTAGDISNQNILLIAEK